MNKEFNRLEKAILEWFINHYKNEELTEQIKNVKFVTREYTKVGFFIDLEVPKNLKLINASILDPRNDVLNNTLAYSGWPIEGPTIKSPDIEFDGGSILFGKDGYISCLELFAYGHFFGEDVQNFNLIEPPKPLAPSL